MSELLRALAYQRDPSHTLDVIKLATPAAGADFTHTFTGAFVRRIISVTGTLVTSAAVANRAIALNIDAPEGTVITVEQAAPVTAGLTTLVSWADGVASDASALVNNRLTAGIGEYIVPPGYVLRSVTGAIDVADQWTNVLVWVESILTQPWPTHTERLTDWNDDQIRAALAAER